MPCPVRSTSINGRVIPTQCGSIGRAAPCYGDGCRFESCCWELRVWFNGRTSGRHPDNEGSIPSTLSFGRICKWRSTPTVNRSQGNTGGSNPSPLLIRDSELVPDICAGVAQFGRGGWLRTSRMGVRVPPSASPFSVLVTAVVGRRCAPTWHFHPMTGLHPPAARSA